MSTGKTYDLKLGYTCNNHCIHCVIEPNRLKMVNENKNKVIDLNYTEIIDCINSEEFKNADTVVLTGGEPTIRKEFMRIVRYIREKYPKMCISIQTNGRLLKKYAKELYELGNINYVVAIHGTEDVHNKVTANLNGNPFRETWESIEEIKNVYGDFNKVGRIEIVLSRFNLNNLIETLQFLYENQVKVIGISYPHLDGFAYSISFEKAREIGFSYEGLKQVIPYVYEFAQNHPDMILQFEQVPMCMWRDRQGNLYKRIGNIISMNHTLEENVSVKYPGDEVNSDFISTFKNMHKQPSSCSKCIQCCSCLGVWSETVDIYGDEGFTPITENERGIC